MTREEALDLDVGVYRLYWREDSGRYPKYSVAAVGENEYGDRWYAPANWMTPMCFDWHRVLRVELIEPSFKVAKQGELL